MAWWGGRRLRTRRVTSDDDGPDPIITLEIRAANRGRSRVLRRRSRTQNAAVSLIAAAVVATGAFAILRDRAHTPARRDRPGGSLAGAGISRGHTPRRAGHIHSSSQSWVTTKGDIAQLDGSVLTRISSDQPPGASFPPASSVSPSERPVSVTVGDAPARGPIRIPKQVRRLCS